MRGRLLGWAAVALICLGFGIGQGFLLDARIRDFDEGVYWQSFRALARGEPLFGSVFASQPPGFYYLMLPSYLIGRSLLSLRLTVLVFAIAGIVATYVAGTALGGRWSGLIAALVVATSALYLHQAAILQADGPSVALSILAFALALSSVRAKGRRGLLLALSAGVVVAVATGVKLLAAVTAVPILIVLLEEADHRWRLLLAAAAGGFVAAALLAVPAVTAPGAAFTQVIASHLRAGAIANQTLADNLRLLLLRREIPLEALAAIGLVTGVVRRARAVLAPAVWAGLSMVAVLLYHPLFPHHLAMLSVPLGLVAGAGLRPPAIGRLRDLRLPQAAIAALVTGTAAAGIVAMIPELHLTLAPDLHDAEMQAAVSKLSQPGDYWISDNPFAVAAAKRDIPGPLVDTSLQRIRTGLLTVDDLESARVAYHVRWVLEDSFRLDKVPGYQDWLAAHFRAVRHLGGDAVIYEANP